MKNRRIKFQYYRIIEQKKSTNLWKGIGKFNFVKWTDNVEKESLLQTPIELSDTMAQIERIHYYKKSNLWAIRFMKLREDNIPSIAKRKKKAEAVKLAADEYLGEDLYMLYDDTNGIAMIQSNRFSLGLTRLAELITHIWGEEGKRISLRPLRQNVDLKSWKKKKYRTIELAFGNIEREMSKEPGSLNSLMNWIRSYSGVSGRVKISVGRNRKGSLNADKVESLVGEIRSDASITSAKATIKDDNKAYIETVDLFDNIYNDVIEYKIEDKTVLDFDYAVNQMIKYYLNKKSELEEIVSFKKK